MKVGCDEADMDQNADVQPGQADQEPRSRRRWFIALTILAALIVWYILTPSLTEAEKSLVGKWSHFLSRKAPNDTLVVYDFQPDRRLIIRELDAATGEPIQEPGKELHFRWRVANGELVFRVPTTREDPVSRAMGWQGWEDESRGPFKVEGDVLTITSTHVRPTLTSKVTLPRYDKP
jgi:hypothetical protein